MYSANNFVQPRSLFCPHRTSSLWEQQGPTEAIAYYYENAKPVSDGRSGILPPSFPESGCTLISILLVMSSIFNRILRFKSRPLFIRRGVGEKKTASDASERLNLKGTRRAIPETSRTPRLPFH